ncbi:YOR152C [Zygosaccharomyces parabailii]|nr:YOR152C [Zygosaccharomyces parabailii]CDH11986.1 uncharacterized protein ZBAI_03772 [Zygosaccharomyces bailii ISA1307]
MFQMIISPLFYLVSSVIPVQITLETLKIVCSHAAPDSTAASNANVPILVLLLKYWAVYALAFGVVPSFISKGILSWIPFGSLMLLGVSCVLTKELLCNFTKFIKTQDSKFVFLFNKLSDVKVSWYQWLTYAASTNENNIANFFVFGEITQLWISLANRVPLADTNYLERTFDYVMQYVGVVTNGVLDHFHSHNTGRAPQAPMTPRGTAIRRGRPSDAGYDEGYDLLDDLIEETKKK